MELSLFDGLAQHKDMIGTKFVTPFFKCTLLFDVRRPTCYFWLADIVEPNSHILTYEFRRITVSPEYNLVQCTGQ
jgi:hypothetical protein